MDKFRKYAQTVPITLESWFLAFVGIILVRIFLEQYSGFQFKHFVLIDMPTLIHYGVFYLATIIALMVILMFFAKTSLGEVAIVCIFGFFVIWIAPIIDLIFAGVGGHIMSYLFVPGEELFIRFITFFNWHLVSGITLGIQIELILGLIFCYLYVYTATKNIIRAVGAVMVFYIFIFFMVSIPSLIVLFLTPQTSISATIMQSMVSSNIIANNIHPSFMSTELGLFNLAFNKLMIGINTVLGIIVVFLFFWLGAQKKLLAIIKNSRPERLFHFFLLFILGSSLVPTSSFFIGWIDVLSYILAFFSFTFAWLFSVCQNDIHDSKIDSVSNPDRPVITQELSKNGMQAASKIFLLFTFLAAYASSHYVLFFVSLFLLVYFIYSNPPLRLKRFVIINSFLVGLACLSVIMAGFFLVSPDKHIIAFSPGLALAIIIFFTAVTNIRDLKDVEGDRADGIKTLSILLGVERAKKLIAGTIGLFYLLIPWYFNIPWLIAPAVLSTILSWYFITKKNYKELPGFVVYMLYLILIIGSLL